MVISCFPNLFIKIFFLSSNLSWPSEFKELEFKITHADGQNSKKHMLETQQQPTNATTSRDVGHAGLSCFAPFCEWKSLMMNSVGKLSN